MPKVREDRRRCRVSGKLVFIRDRGREREKKERNRDIVNFKVFYLAVFKINL